MAKRGSNTGRTIRTIGIGGAILAGLMFIPNLIGAAMVGNNLTASFRGIEINGVGGNVGAFRLRLTLIMRLINPTSFNAKVDFINVNVITPGGLPFADVTRTNANYVIPPRSDQDVRIPMEINLTTTLVAVLVPSLITAIAGKVQGLTTQEIFTKVKAAIPGTLNITGNVRVNSILVGISQKLTVIKPAV